MLLLATLDDLEDRLGSISEPVKAQAALKGASAAVRAAAGGQQISRATSTVRLVPSRDGIVRFPQWPIVDDAYASGVLHNVWCAANYTYTHGYNPVPEDIIALVCQIAGRALGTAPTSAGVQSETLGAYSYSVGAAAAAGPLGMLNDERKIAQRYRRPRPPISTLPVSCSPSSTWDTMRGVW